MNQKLLFYGQLWHTHQESFFLSTVPPLLFMKLFLVLAVQLLGHLSHHLSIGFLGGLHLRRDSFQSDNFWRFQGLSPLQSVCMMCGHTEWAHRPEPCSETEAAGNNGDRDRRQRKRVHTCTENKKWLLPSTNLLDFTRKSCSMWVHFSKGGKLTVVSTPPPQI